MIYVCMLNAYGVKYRSERENCAQFDSSDPKKPNVIAEQPVIFLQTTAKK